MHNTIQCIIDGNWIEVRPGTTVAAALLGSGTAAFRRSVSGEPRGPLCGMGVCFECRVTIDGVAHRLACQTACVHLMEVRTDGHA
jgi:sarcosine oxidase subunit alpha